MQSMSVIPAEITILAYIHYELAADLDCRRRQHGTPSWQGAACTSSAGHTEVELRLASCGSRGYVAKIADILQQVLSCEHGGRVFVEHNAFKNDGTYASCKGVKSLAPFTGLRHTGPGCICPRLVLDDCLAMWGLDPAKDAVRLMPTTSWKGRWPQPSSNVCASADSDDEQDAALAALAAQEAAEAATAATTTGDSTAETIQQQQQQQAPVITYISSPRPAAAVLPVPPQGLTVLLPEVLKLVAKELVEAEAKLPPIMPPSLPAHLLPKALAALQRTDSAASGNSTCPSSSTCITSSAYDASASTGSPLRGSPRANNVAVRRKGISPRLGLGLGRQSPGGKRRRSSSSSNDLGGGGSLAGLGAAFDAAA
ncbi:hypothetical protein OEZ86_013346 [Tetradesmus obliquus]|nr:hypothetical protein OEZ86_013346 [Tetradesmus obliquus]